MQSDSTCTCVYLGSVGQEKARRATSQKLQQQGEGGDEIRAVAASCVSVFYASFKISKRYFYKWEKMPFLLKNFF